MKRLLTTLLTSLVVIMATGAAQAAMYTSKAWGFSMEMPAGWDKTEFPDQAEGVVMVFHGPHGGVLIIRLARESVDFGNGTVRDDVLDDFLASLEENGMQDIEILDEGFADLKEGKGYGMHYRYFLPDGLQVESVSTFIAGPDRYFVLTYAAVPPVYQKQIEDMAGVLKSFRIIPPELEKEFPGRGGKYI